MGKRWKRRNNESRPTNQPNEKNYPQVELENQGFEKYYKAQNILDEPDFELFMASLKTPLPVSFRITGSRNYASELKEFMKTKLFPPLNNVVIEDIKIPPPTPLEWYPNELGWVYDCGRTTLRKSPEVGEFHRFLVSETEVGNVSRQEAVSMIPVLLMDVQPGNLVIDMCAAPGSKTAQLLEGVLGDDHETFPKGLVIANDSDQKRAYMLVHQAKRLQTPILMVTNHDAQDFPRIIIDHDGKPSNALQFDRVLCDVPCSGDGTMRKNKMIWNTWNASNGNGLHKLQRSILFRGCELLKVGGRLVYSTCSFNPIENEAVVASFLQECNGALKLVDVSNELKGLKRFPGMTNWLVSNKHGEILTEYQECKGVQQTMFPPDGIKEMGMEKCLRIYPHLQNSGGFFVAVFEKITEFGSIDKYNSSQLERNPTGKRKRSPSPTEKNIKVTAETENQENVVVKSKGWMGEIEAPFMFLDKDDAVVKACCDIYGLDPSFPRDLFVVRSEKQEQDYSSIYIVSDFAKTVLTSRNAESLKVVNTGVKAFVKNGGKNFSQCPYRICSEGVPTVAPHLAKERQVPLSLDDLVIMIKHEYPKFSEFSLKGQEQLAALNHGSCILSFDPCNESNYNGSLNRPVILPFFRAHVSCSLLLDKAERKSLLNRLTGEILDKVIGLQK